MFFKFSVKVVRYGLKRVSPLLFEVKKKKKVELFLDLNEATTRYRRFLRLKKSKIDPPYLRCPHFNNYSTFFSLGFFRLFAVGVRVQSLSCPGSRSLCGNHVREQLCWHIFLANIFAKTKNFAKTFFLYCIYGAKSRDTIPLHFFHAGLLNLIKSITFSAKLEKNLFKSC